MRTIQSTKTEPETMHVPDEALHLAHDSQFARNLRSHGHNVKTTHNLVVARHKDTNAMVAWMPETNGEPHPISYRAQIIRSLVRLGFWPTVVLILGIALHMAGVF